MALNLQKTLSWKSAHEATSPDSAAELAMLHDLQGNILKGHGRHFTSNIFLKFAAGRQKDAKKFVASVAHDISSALDQLLAAELRKSRGTDGGVFITLLLTAEGYKALGRGDAQPPGKAFDQGMANRELNDNLELWEQDLKDMHALIIVGTSVASWRDAERDALLARINATNGAVLLKGEPLSGDALFQEGRGIEHFGYVDGRSQPLMLQEDIDKEKKNGGIDQWDPSIPLSQVLVRCPGGELEVSHGSFFVWRKLEQKVRAFKEQEDALGKALEQEGGLGKGAVGERAGASVVGRFENGTPVILSETEVGIPPNDDFAVRNNFNYLADADGLKCPYAAHIRKTNPRTDTVDSKTHLMARRGIPFGTRDDDLDDPNPNNKPENGVGLIFMAYQSSIENQFEFTQSAWANNVDFARPLAIEGPETGIDPVIGQHSSEKDRSLGQLYPIEWNKRMSNKPFDFSEFVTMRGGEYFFAPSISFLKNV